MADVTAEDHGTVMVLIPHTPESREWIDDNVHSEPYNWLGEDRLAGDFRPMKEVVELLQAAGFEVEIRCPKQLR